MRLCFILLMLLLSMVPSMAQNQTQYSVKSGETYARIAAKYGIDESTLRRANKDCPNDLFPGLILVIPERSKQASFKAQKPVERGTFDRVTLQDSSFIDCKILSLNKTMLRFKQDGVDASLQIAVREICEIRYASGVVKRYGRSARKGGKR